MAAAYFKHGLYYPSAHDIPLSDIAATLIAHERMMPVVAEIIQRAVPGVVVQQAVIRLNRIQRSSLDEAFFVALLVVYQKDLEREVPAVLEALTGYHISDRFDTLVTVLMMIVLFYGAKALVGRKKKGESESKAAPSIEGNYNNYISIAADQRNIGEQSLREIVERSVPSAKRPAIMRAAIDLFRPAKRNGDSEIVPRGLDPISADDVADFPSDVALADFAEDTVPISFENAQLHLRATDRDKHDSGWAGTLETKHLTTKRLPVKLYPTVNPDKLANIASAQVEAILESKIKEDGGLKPYRIHVLKLTDQRQRDEWHDT